MRPILNVFNWWAIWFWFKYPIMVAMLIGLIWWLYGCVPQFPYTPVNPSKSQIMIDIEVETVRTINEAYRKLQAAGCDREDLKLKRPIAVRGKSFYEFECRLASGVMVKLYKLNGEWIIVPGE